MKEKERRSVPHCACLATQPTLRDGCICTLPSMAVEAKRPPLPLPVKSDSEERGTPPVMCVINALEVTIRADDDRRG